jgi:lysophospholipase L1-like esterase
VSGAHRTRHFAGVKQRFLILAAVVLVVVGGGAGWLAGLGPGHASKPQPPSWRTGWALSLAHSGVLDGSNLTCRLIARVAITGSQVRFRLVNYPATTPVTFSHLVVGIRTTGLAIDPATQREVTVGGSASVTLAPDGDVLTDPTSLPVQRGQDLALSIAVSSGVSSPWHYWSPQKSGCTEVGAGDVANEVGGSRFTKDSEIRWLSEVRVLTQTPVTTVAAYGDSITDGLFLPVDTSGRWTDLVQNETGGRLVVLNYGVSGDQLTGPIAGQLPRRLTTDVLAPAGVSAVVVQLGSNDIAAGVNAGTIVEQYRRIVAKVEAAGESVIVATVPGRGDDLPKGAERQRLLLNQALRTFPIVADLDAVLTDPQTGSLEARYDIGDHVHPNPAGVAVIARVMRDAFRKVPGPLSAAVS